MIAWPWHFSNSSTYHHLTLATVNLKRILAPFSRIIRYSGFILRSTCDLSFLIANYTIYMNSPFSYEV